MTKKGIHDKRLDELILKPSILGIDDVVMSAQEVNIYSDEGRLLGQPDLMFVTKYHDIYVVEYKCNNNKINKAVEQLDRTETFMYNQFGLPIKKIYTHNKFEMMKVK